MLEQLLATGSRQGPIDSGPGPQELIGGDINAGFYGEVPVADLINGPTLATQCSLTMGTSQFPNEPWLKFALDRKTLFVAKKPFRHTVAWSYLNTAGILDGSKALLIQGRTYKVRLLKSFIGGYPSGGNIYTFAPSQCNGSEWNRLMYHVSGKPFANAGNVLTAEGITEGDWAKYTEAELYTLQGSGRLGTFSICPERNSFGNNMSRGGNGVSQAYTFTATSDGGAGTQGWRPCLELMA